MNLDIRKDKNGGTCPTVEHPTNRGTLYSMQNTLLTAEHPTHREAPYSPQNTLLTGKYLTHHRTPYLPRNTLLTAKHPTHCGTPYSPWTYPMAEHPTHLGPAPHGTAYSLNGIRTSKIFHGNGTLHDNRDL